MKKINKSFGKKVSNNLRRAGHATRNVALVAICTPVGAAYVAGVGVKAGAKALGKSTKRVAKRTVRGVRRAAALTVGYGGYCAFIGAHVLSGQF